MTEERRRPLSDVQSVEENPISESAELKLDSGHCRAVQSGRTCSTFLAADCVRLYWTTFFSASSSVLNLESDPDTSKKIITCQCFRRISTSPLCRVISEHYHVQRSGDCGEKPTHVSALSSAELGLQACFRSVLGIYFPTAVCQKVRLCRT